MIPAGLAVAVAILTRSLIGVFSLGVMAAHLLLTKRYRLALSPQFAAMWVIALALPMVWFGFPPRPEHMAFVAGKLAGGSNWFEYGWLILKSYWPWLPLLLIGLVVEVRARKLLPLLWCVCLIVPLSAAATKYARYLIPAFPAMAILSAAGVDRLLPVARRTMAFSVACAVGLVIAAFTVVFPAKERGMDMRTLAPVAERNTAPAERILLYTMGKPGYDSQNQLLWYSARYTRLMTDMGALEEEHNATVIIDKTSLRKLTARIHVLAESDNFVCLRIS